MNTILEVVGCTVGAAWVILAILCCGFFDRLRGDPLQLHKSLGRGFEKIVYGLFIAHLAGVGSLYGVVVVALLFAVGASPGWGACYGAYIDNRRMRDAEWWQFGIFKTNIMAAIILRGAIWAIPIIPGCYFYGGWGAPVAIFAAFPAALIIGRYTTLRFRIKKLGVSDEWGESEIIRGVLAGTFAYAISFII